MDAPQTAPRYYLLTADGSSIAAGVHRPALDPSENIVALPDNDPRVVAWKAAQVAASLPTTCTKLGLKRAFDELGIWAQVRQMIAANPAMQEEWDLATELRVTDPIVQEAISGLAQMGLPMTPDEVPTLIARANALV